MVVCSNEYFAAKSFLYLHEKNIEVSDKKDIVSSTEFEAIIHSTQEKLFHQRMINFVNKLELSDKKHKTNRNVGYRNHNRKLFFTMKDFVPFGTYCQSMYFMSTRFLK